MTRRDNIQRLIVLYNRRLQKLREQEALRGISTPPEILIEIEDLEKKLAGLQTELKTESAEPASFLSDDELAWEVTRLSGDQPSPSSSTQMGGFNLSNVSGSTINIGNVNAGVSAGGDIVGGDKITTTTSTGPSDPAQAQAQLEAALAQWRQEIEANIAALSDLDDGEKEELKEKTSKVQQEAAKGNTANPGKLERLLNSMNAMAPDILEVTTTTLQNPFKGVGLVLQKINDRIKLERVG